MSTIEKPIITAIKSDGFRFAQAWEIPTHFYNSSFGAVMTLEEVTELGLNGVRMVPCVEQEEEA